MFEIDDDVEFKTSKKSRHSKVMELPFAQLEIGQSFHLVSEKNQREQAARLSAWCQLAGKRLDRRFSMRTVAEEDPRGPGLRIWRVEDAVQSLDKIFEQKQQPTRQAVPLQRKRVATPVLAGKPTANPGSRRARKAETHAIY